MPPQCQANADRAIHDYPAGHAQISMLQPSRNRLHRLALWFVNVDLFDESALPLEPDGEREIREGTLQWRDASVVIRNLLDFNFATNHAQALINYFASFTNCCMDAHEPSLTSSTPE